MQMISQPVQGWPTGKRTSQRATFRPVFPQRPTSYTWTHVNVTPSLPYSHTHLFATKFIVNSTRQSNDTNLQAIYCYSCNLVGLWHSLSWITSSSNMACIPLQPIEALLSHGCQSEQIDALISRISGKSLMKPGKESHAPCQPLVCQAYYWYLPFFVRRMLQKTVANLTSLTVFVWVLACYSPHVCLCCSSVYFCLFGEGVRISCALCIV